MIKVLFFLQSIALTNMFALSLGEWYVFQKFQCYRHYWKIHNNYKICKFLSWTLSNLQWKIRKGTFKTHKHRLPFRNIRYHILHPICGWVQVAQSLVFLYCCLYVCIFSILAIALSRLMIRNDFILSFASLLKVIWNFSLQTKMLLTCHKTILLFDGGFA